MARDRAKTEAKILAAIGDLLVEPAGFRGLGVNAVAERAEVDKVLIYRYFDGLPGALAAYGAGADLWPGVEEVLGGGGREDDLSAVLGRLVTGYLAALRKRPATLEIMAWEACERNPLTDAVHAARKKWEKDVTERVFKDRKVPARIDIQAVLAILAAAADSLAVRGRVQADCNGVPLNDDTGWRRIDDAIRQILDGAMLKAAARS